MEGSVKPFTLTITHWLVGGSTVLGKTIQSAELVDQGILKTPALVRMQVTWDTKLVEPFRDQNLGHR